MQGKANAEVKDGIDENGIAPANRLGEEVTHRPEDGRSQAAEQSEIGDGAPGLSPAELGQGGEGCIVEDKAHRDAEHEPAEHIDPSAVGEYREERNPRRRVASRPTSCAVRQRRSIDAAGGTRDRPAQKQCRREGAENQRLGPAAVGCNIGRQRAQRIECGSPADDLGYTQRRDGRPKRLVGSEFIPPDRIGPGAAAGMIDDGNAHPRAWFLQQASPCRAY